MTDSCLCFGPSLIDRIVEDQLPEAHTSRLHLRLSCFGKSSRPDFGLIFASGEPTEDYAWLYAAGLEAAPNLSSLCYKDSGSFSAVSRPSWFALPLFFSLLFRSPLCLLLESCRSQELRPLPLVSRHRDRGNASCADCWKLDLRRPGVLRPLAFRPSPLQRLYRRALPRPSPLLLGLLLDRWPLPLRSSPLLNRPAPHRPARSPRLRALCRTLRPLLRQPRRKLIMPTAIQLLDHSPKLDLHWPLVSQHGDLPWRMVDQNTFILGFFPSG
jgi:hypothetical protein